MHRFLLFIGMGTALVAGAGCAPMSAETPLTAAAARNDADEIRRLLSVGHDPDEADGGATTALIWAARSGAVEAMTALIDAGANVNHRDSRHRWTVLLHAIHTQQPAAVRLLLERGADPNAATPGGVTPLLMAADDPDPTTVRLLLAHGANPHVEGPGGATPLTQAVSGGALTDFTDRPLLGGCHPATVRALLAHDPSLAIPKTFAGRQAVWWARFNKCTEVLRLVDVRQAGAAEQAISGVGLLRDAAANAARSNAAGPRTPPDGRPRTPATDAQPRR